MHDWADSVTVAWMQDPAANAAIGGKRACVCMCVGEKIVWSVGVHAVYVCHE